MPLELLVVLSLVIVTALAFDFTNGFHDTGNAMAPSIATGALKPKTAVMLSALLNLIGAFLSVEVALTVTNAVVNLQDDAGAPRPELLGDGGEGLLLIILSGLAGAIIWNLLTWLWSLPSSSSHALFGGLVGAPIAGLGRVFAITRTMDERRREKRFKWGQVGSASLISLAHGTNDAQKTMGVITLALIATGSWTELHSVPFWVKVACAVAIALGTYLGGWRIIRTLGKGLVEINAPQGMAADASSAAVILASSHMGFALSTTHVATGSILGSGLGRSKTKVNWRVAGRMLASWAITLPAAALVGAVMWGVGHLIGGLAGALAVFLILVATSLWMYLHSRKSSVDHSNVNDEWVENATAPRPLVPEIGELIDVEQTEESKA